MTKTEEPGLVSIRMTQEEFVDLVDMARRVMIGQRNYRHLPANEFSALADLCALADQVSASDL